MSSIKNVAIVGASGSLGSVIFEKFVASGKFRVRVLKRASSSAKFPPGTEVVDVDYNSLESAKSALAGQDAVILVLNGADVQAQKNIVDAAIATGVKRLIPSDFGSNMDNPNTRKLPVFVQKIEVQDYIIEKSKTTSLTYTTVYNGAFFDWGIKHNFLLNGSEGKASLIDDGEYIFSATTLPSIADGVIGILSHPEETKNRAVYIHNAVLSQNQLLSLAKKANPNKSWEVTHVKLSELTKESDERLAKGLYDLQTFGPYIIRAIFDPAYGGNYTGFTDNELLGVKEFNEAELLEIVKSSLPA